MEEKVSPLGFDTELACFSFFVDEMEVAARINNNAFFRYDFDRDMPLFCLKNKIVQNLYDIVIQVFCIGHIQLQE